MLFPPAEPEVGESQGRRCVHHIAQELVAVDEIEHFLGVEKLAQTAGQLAERAAAHEHILRQEEHECEVIEVAIARYAEIRRLAGQQKRLLNTK